MMPWAWWGPRGSNNVAKIGALAVWRRAVMAVQRVARRSGHRPSCRVNSGTLGRRCKRTQSIMSKEDMDASGLIERLAPFQPVRSSDPKEQGQAKPADGSKESAAAPFEPTQWSVVILAAYGGTPEGQAAFAQLYERYWFPLYAFVRRKGYSPHDAQDLIQGFFLDLLQRETLTRVDRRKGKFRSFLLACLQNHLSNEAQRAGCFKRGGSCEWVHLDFDNAEDLYLTCDSADGLTPEQLFDARWAVTLLGRALTVLRREYAARGKASTFEVLKNFLDPRHCSSSYEQAAKALGVSTGAVKTMASRLRSRHVTILRQEIARTVCDPREIDEEIHALCNALIACEGRAGN
jgi:DNA-directed RNA polymerase specialized sigma24 family protein